MATLLSAASGNFTSSATWRTVANYQEVAGVAPATPSTATTITTTDTNVNTVTPGAITVSGVILQMRSRVASPTGTMTVSIFNVTTSTTVATVTVNVSQIPNTNATSAVGNHGIGFIYFPFASNVTLVAGQAYTIRAVTSTTTQVTIWSTACCVS